MKSLKDFNYLLSLDRRYTKTESEIFRKFGKPVFPLRRQYPKQRREPQHRSDVEAFL